MLPRCFFLGLIRVEQWGYRWGFTSAQIELLAVDTPIIVYPKRNKGKNGNQRKPKAIEVKSASRRWQQKYGTENSKKIDLSELIGGFQINKNNGETR